MDKGKNKAQVESIREEKMEINFTMVETKKLFLKVRFNSFLQVFINLSVILIFLHSIYSVFDSLISNSPYLRPDIGMLIAVFLVFYTIVIRPVLSAFDNIEKLRDGRLKYMLNDEGIIEKTSLTEVKLNWRLLKDVSQIEGYLLLKLETGGYILIPNEVLTPESKTWLCEKAGVKGRQRTRGFFSGGHKY